MQPHFHVVRVFLIQSRCEGNSASLNNDAGSGRPAYSPFGPFSQAAGSGAAFDQAVFGAPRGSRITEIGIKRREDGRLRRRVMMKGGHVRRAQGAVVDPQVVDAPLEERAAGKPGADAEIVGIQRRGEGCGVKHGLGQNPV